jgi:preprotein translocase subunit SecA
MASLFSGIFGGEVKKAGPLYTPIIAQINDLEKEYETLSGEDIKGKTASFKARIEGGESLDSILPEAFALVREAAKRTLGQRHFDVQHHNPFGENRRDAYR